MKLVLALIFNSLIVCLTLVKLSVVNSTIDLVFTIMFGCIILFLPLLIARVIFLKNLLGMSSALCYSIYPILFFLNKTLEQISGSEPGGLNVIFGLLIIFIFVVLNSALLFTATKSKIFSYLDTLLTLLLITFMYFLVMSVIRDFGSIISTDLLVHKTVTNAMNVSSQIFLMPADYSNTFTDQAYPIIYFHTIMHFFLNSFKIDFILGAYVIDFVFTFVISLISYCLAQKYLRNEFLATIAVLFAIFSFENLAYSFHFFIPQTLCFLFVLLILHRVAFSGIKFFEIVIVSFILLFTHFYIGFYLLFILLVVLFTYKNRIKLEVPLLLFCIFSAIISLTGFSVEAFMQQDILNWTGLATTNPNFESKLIILFSLNSIVTVLLIPAYLNYFFIAEARLTKMSLYGLLINITVFFLAPVFAGKFLIGTGFYCGIVITQFLKQFKFSIVQRSLIASSLVIILSINFLFQFSTLLPFLEQNGQGHSAIAKQDNDLVEYWQNYQPQCLVISDPQTQLVVHSLGRGNSVRGSYMSIEMRQSLSAFVNRPTVVSLNSLLSYSELEVLAAGKNKCLVMSSRLRYMVDNEHSWANSIVNYLSKNPGELEFNDMVNTFLRDELELKPFYQDDYFSVYELD